MQIHEPVFDLIETLYDAALDEALWPEALRKLADFTGSQAATLWVLDGSGEPRLPVFTYVNLEPAFIQDYLANTAAIDPTVQYLVKHPGEPIVHDGLVISERDKDRHPYYAWHHRYSDLRFRIVGQMSPAPTVQAGVALHRTRSVGRFEPRDIEQFAALQRHLRRALQIGFKLGTLGTLERLATEVLDRHPAGVLLLDERKHIVYMNRSAQALGGQRDGIALSPQGLTAARKQDHDRLQRLIAQARPDAVPGAGRRGGVMRIARHSGKRPYVLLVAPVASGHPALSAFRPAVCIVISDPDCETPLPSERLQAAFGLTEAEARLAALLGAGTDLRSAAETLRVTYGTARARLAEIFDKTQTRRQTELVKLLLTIMTLG